MKPPRPEPKPSPVEAKPLAAPLPVPLVPLIQRHLRVGWWTLLVFLTLGLVLESFHGFKVEAYLKVSNEIRRLMWTLAHAHGTLLGLINIAFAVTVRSLAAWPEKKQRFASASLRAA